MASESSLWLRAGGALLSFAASVLGRRARALTPSGALAAALGGTVLAACGGWAYLTLVGAFFVTSSAATRLDPPGGAARSADRGGRRWDQVVANGGVAILAAALHGATGRPEALLGAAGAVAAATADTWATELGRWSGTPPRLITTWSPVPPGTSGAVTLLGTLAAAGGAAFIGGIAAALAPGQPLRTAAGVATAGFTGALLDSLLGATLEGRIPWVGNNAVNVSATLWGALAALLLARPSPS